MENTGEKQTDPLSWEQAEAFVLSQMEADGYQKSSIDGTRVALKWLEAFMTERGIHSVKEVTKEDMRAFVARLNYMKMPSGARLSAATRATRMTSLRWFFKILAMRGRLLRDMSIYLPVPQRGRRLPRGVLTAEQISAVLSQPDVKTSIGFRDRVILELLYGTGVRNGELRGIKVDDVDLEKNQIKVTGKGSKDRVVPIPADIVPWVREYIENVHPLFAARAEKKNGEHHGHVFMGRFGRPLSKDAIWFLVRRYAELAGLDARVSCHLFRHTCATHLLQNGMDIRYIQELLGHRSLMTTQIYTRVAAKDLRQQFRHYHPRARYAVAHRRPGYHP